MDNENLMLTNSYASVAFVKMFTYINGKQAYLCCHKSWEVASAGYLRCKKHSKNNPISQERGPNAENIKIKPKVGCIVGAS